MKAAIRCERNFCQIGLEAVVRKKHFYSWLTTQLQRSETVKTLNLHSLNVGWLISTNPWAAKLVEQLMTDRIFISEPMLETNTIL